MAELSEIVGFPGAYATLRALARSSAGDPTKEDIKRLMGELGVSQPEAALNELVGSSLIRRNADTFCLTTLGFRTALLLEAINGGDLKEMYRRLSQLDSSLRAYELVQEGMANTFLRSLVHRPGFGRLYICSPWITLGEQEQQILLQAVDAVAQRRGQLPEILVATRPVDGTPVGVPRTLWPLVQLGARVYLHSRLHTKLYIREPDTSGGYAMGILGSENLTGSHCLELGIRVNCDGHMISQMVAYFLALTTRCLEITKEALT